MRGPRTPDAGSEVSDEQAPGAIVGIGASAGGLAALRGLFSHVPPDSGIAFVIVVHLDPEHESHLADLLQHHIRMPVHQVVETMPVEPNQVYVIPPGYNLDSIDTHLRLSSLEAERRERAPIDHFFRTLAKTHDGHAVGVILTGTGSDGTLGMKEIKEHGGLTVVQDPSDAEYDGMPQSALSTGLIDLVLPLAEIPQAILRYARTRPRVRVPSDDETVAEEERQLLQKVFAQLRARTDRDFSRYKRSTLLRRIQHRMQLRHVEELAAYLELLRDEGAEVCALADDLLITVTSFFRDPEVFAVLAETVVPKLFEGKRNGDEVRVWSIGCATGEEAYSLAMLVVEEAERQAASPRIQVFATDLHERSLRSARDGFYPGDVQTEVSARRLERFFQRESYGYRVRKELREKVVFAHHNLLGDPPFSHCDLIACRNLLIYLQRDVQNEVVELFHYALSPQGHLLLGSSETVDASELFLVEDKKSCIFRKRNVRTPEPRLPVFPLTRSHPAGERRQDERLDWPEAYGALHHRMVERYAPPSLLLSPDDRVLHLSEHAGRYLVHPGGVLTASVFRLVRNELRLELRSLLHAARESGMPTTSRPLAIAYDDGEREIVLHVRPTHEAKQKGFALVIFEERSELPVAADGSAEDAAGGNGSQLEQELDLTRQRLRAMIEEHETSREEMRASNEELQSTNEELRSTMEELETSKEELQSMNEELQTVNQENRHKVEELSQLSSDLQNLLAATDIATLFLDHELRILRFTPKVGELFNVRMADRGRPISDLTHRLGYAELREDARRVLGDLAPIERKVSDEEGRSYLARIMPYRSTADRIEGVVLTFVDVTPLQRAEDALRELNEHLEQRVEQRTREVRRLSGRLTRAEQIERRRIARILHDDLQQLLHGVQMKLAVVRSGLEAGSSETVLVRLDEAEKLLASSTALTRRLSIDLSPPVLDGDSLAEPLRWLSEQMKQRHDLDVELAFDGEPAIPREEDRVLLFEAVRELLFNVVKHAGTRQARIELAGEGDGGVRIRVSDDGDGFDPEAIAASGTGMGFASLDQRLELAGGSVDLESSPGTGSAVTLRLTPRPAAKEGDSR